jgi:hypothetical protein
MGEKDFPMPCFLSLLIWRSWREKKTCFYIHFLWLTMKSALWLCLSYLPDSCVSLLIRTSLCSSNNSIVLRQRDQKPNVSEQSSALFYICIRVLGSCQRSDLSHPHGLTYLHHPNITTLEKAICRKLLRLNQKTSFQYGQSAKRIAVENVVDQSDTQYQVSLRGEGTAAGSDWCVDGSDYQCPSWNQSQ